MNEYKMLLMSYAKIKNGFEKEWSKHKSLAEQALHNMDLMERSMNMVRGKMCPVCRGKGWIVDDSLGVTLRIDCVPCCGTGIKQ